MMLYQRHLLVLLSLIGVTQAATPDQALVLRVRLPDGSMERLQVADPSLSLREVLEAVTPVEQLQVRRGSETVDDQQAIQDLNLAQGTLLTLASPNQRQQGLTKKPVETHTEQRFDPFPDLARDYHRALLTRRRKTASGSLSYGDLASLQSSLHVVEPQSDPRVTRIYMCRLAAERFQASCVGTSIQNRCGLLFGNVSRERAAKHRPKRGRTSLSSTTEDEDFVSVAKVHALWDPRSKSASYACEPLLDALEPSSQVLKIADWLGLEPIGWIFTYDNDRHDNDGLPVFGRDLWAGGRLQASNMQRIGIDQPRFVTLAMDARNGATEAFQLSDVCVQMVAEGLLDKPKDTRMVTVEHSVLVDGKEVQEFDSVLCLVNTAMLSHEGSFSSSTNPVKKNGSLTNKTRKALLQAIEADNDKALLEKLCDFNLLLALDELLLESDSKSLCAVVKKWARGQKLGTAVDDKLKIKLKAILEH